MQNIIFSQTIIYIYRQIVYRGNHEDFTTDNQRGYITFAENMPQWLEIQQHPIPTRSSKSNAHIKKEQQHPNSLLLSTYNEGKIVVS